jgi:hypothetical protein
MDCSTNGTYSLNELILRINLQGRSFVKLTFWHKEFNDESNEMPATFSGSSNSDGVAISADGINWYRVVSLTTGTGTWQKHEYYLDPVVSAAGISYNSNFYIKFQQYDNYSYSTDGFAFDDISCNTPAVVRADFNGDGNVDILWRYHGTGGYNAVWLRGTASAAASLMSVPLKKNSVIVVDMENVGKKRKVVDRVDMDKMFSMKGLKKGDIKDGFDKYKMPGGNHAGRFIDPFDTEKIIPLQIISRTMASSVTDPRNDPQSEDLMAVADQNWKLCGTGDFNKDGKVDIVWSNVDTAHNCVWYMDGTTFAGYAQLPDGSTTDWVLGGVGDFDRDGNPDLIWNNVADGRNGVWYLDGVQLKGIDIMTTGANVDWKLCGTGDFNNDGHVDLVWRNTIDGRNAVWYMDGVELSSVGWLDSVADQNWKLRGTGDFNNDGKIDLIWTYISDGRNCIWYLDGVTLTSVEFLTTVTDIDWKIEN